MSETSTLQSNLASHADKVTLSWRVPELTQFGSLLSLTASGSLGATEATPGIPPSWFPYYHK